MARVEIEPRMAAALKRIKALQGRIEDPSPILQDVGDVLRKTTISRFYSQKPPTGKPWRPSKAARRERRRTLWRTGRGVESITTRAGGGRIEVGTDVGYLRVHQQGGPIDAEYKKRKGRRAGFRPPKINLNPSIGSAQRLARAALKRKRRQAPRKVRLPARRFLGISKRDRKRTTTILIDRLKEALQ